MKAYDLILKKREGGSLTTAEIREFIRGYVHGEIPDYQMAAFLMAVYFRGMSYRETADLTMAMVESGKTIDLSSIPGKKLDKHSTGGVGDKVTLVLAPMVAALGVPVAKLAGRGLGHTGGTIDKLESFPGLRTSISLDQLVNQVKKLGIAIAGHTSDLVPADAKMYALRDVTATVDSIPLIASSVMSKKIAGGADAIVLDVKTGAGAFMRKYEDALKLAETMVRIGTLTGRPTVALITDMDQPLGNAVGNALEVKEAIAALSGRGPSDLMELCFALGEQMLVLGGAAESPDEGRKRLTSALNSGAALHKLRQLVAAQGGNPAAVDDSSFLPQAPVVIPVGATQDGFVHELDALSIGRAAACLGAGRETMDSPIDLSVGVVLERKVGDRVASGDVLAWVHGPDSASASEAAALVSRAYVIRPEPASRPKLIKSIVTEKGVTTFV